MWQPNKLWIDKMKKANKYKKLLEFCNNFNTNLFLFVSGNDLQGFEVGKSYVVKSSLFSSIHYLKEYSTINKTSMVLKNSTTYNLWKVEIFGK